MASITHRGPYQYQALIRRKGYPTQTKTFETLEEAQKWAAKTEAEMTLGSFIDRSTLERMTFGDLLARYAKEETPKKRGSQIEVVRNRSAAARSLRSRGLLREPPLADRLPDRRPGPGDCRPPANGSALGRLTPASVPPFVAPPKGTVRRGRRPATPADRPPSPSGC